MSSRWAAVAAVVLLGACAAHTSKTITVTTDPGRACRAAASAQVDDAPAGDVDAYNRAVDTYNACPGVVTPMIHESPTIPTIPPVTIAKP